MPGARTSGGEERRKSQVAAREHNHEDGSGGENKVQSEREIEDDGDHQRSREIDRVLLVHTFYFLTMWHLHLQYSPQEIYIS
jgi:hypothetical protein